MGTLALREAWHHAPNPDEREHRFSQYIESQIDRHRAHFRAFRAFGRSGSSARAGRIVAGLGSTVTDSAWLLSGDRLSRYKSRYVNGKQAEWKQLRRLHARLAKLTAGGSIGSSSRPPGIRDPLGHQLGLAALLAVLDALGVPVITACGTGLRFGLAFAFLHGIPLTIAQTEPGPVGWLIRPCKEDLVRAITLSQLLPQVVGQGFEDQIDGEPALDLVVGLEATVGQHEDILGLESRGEGLGGAAVVGIGAGGLQAGGLPEDAPEEPRQLADQQAGAPPLVDRFLPRLLDVIEHAMGQGRRVESMVGGQLVDQGAAESLEPGVGQSRWPGWTLPSPRAASRSASAWSPGHALFQQQLGDVGRGQRVEPDDLAARDDRLELDLGRRADQDQHRARRRLLQRLQERVGGLLVEVVGVVEDRHLAHAPRRLAREMLAKVADHVDRQLVLVLGPGGFDEIGVGLGLDLEAAGA